MAIGTHAQRQNRLDGRLVVVGIAEHTGWAILVSVAAVNRAPAVVDRRRVPLIDEALPGQPYEHGTQALKDDDAEQLLRRVKRSIAACTALAFDQLAADLSPRYNVSSIAIRQPALTGLPATVREVHASYFTLCRADGVLYHSALCADARKRGWGVMLHRRGEELGRAAKALRASTDDVEQFIGDLKRTLRPPWSGEHRSAFAAAIANLSEHSTLRIPRRSRECER